MIKAIACDIDGTLLNTSHQLSEENIHAIEKVRKAGIKFFIATGRKFKDARKVISRPDLIDGYIAISGAQVCDGEGNILAEIPMPYEQVKQVTECVRRHQTAVSLHSTHCDYMIGTPEEVREGLIEEMSLFFGVGEDKLKESPIFQEIQASTKSAKSVEELEEKGIPVFKVFVFSEDEQALELIDAELAKIPQIASASSFKGNIEVTNIEAQKGPVIARVMDEMGVEKEEIMVLGDSMNDYSMMSMDFGATVAMENSMEGIKEVAAYQTKTNDENGVAVALEKMLQGTLEEMRIR